MARPKTPESDKLGKPFQIRLKPEERRIIDAAARELSLASSSWARSVLVREAKKAVKNS